MIFELFFISAFTLYEYFQTTMTSYPTLKFSPMALKEVINEKNNIIDKNNNTLPVSWFVLFNWQAVTIPSRTLFILFFIPCKQVSTSIEVIVFLLSITSIIPTFESRCPRGWRAWWCSSNHCGNECGCCYTIHIVLDLCLCQCKDKGFLYPHNSHGCTRRLLWPSYP